MQGLPIIAASPVDAHAKALVRLHLGSVYAIACAKLRLPQDAIRRYLLDNSCYNILPESFRLIVLDNELTVKRALAALALNGPSLVQYSGISLSEIMQASLQHRYTIRQRTDSLACSH